MSKIMKLLWVMAIGLVMTGAVSASCQLSPKKDHLIGLSRQK